MVYWTNPDTIPAHVENGRWVKQMPLSRVQFWVNNPDCCSQDHNFRWWINKDVRGMEGRRDSLNLNLTEQHIYEIWGKVIDKSGGASPLSNQCTIDLRQNRPTLMEKIGATFRPVIRWFQSP